MSTAIVRRCLSELSGTQTASTDTELLSRYTERKDSEAFAELVRRHGPVVLATCQRILGTSTDAEDAFQTVFLTLIRSACSIHNPAALPAWLHRTAIRIALRVRTRQLSTTSLPSGAADSSDPFADMAWRDLRRVLDEELDRLPEKYRVPLVLCLLDGCTRDEAAERLRCSLNTVKRRLEAGRELLRDRLLRRGVTPILLAVCVFETNGARAFVPPNLIAGVLKAANIVPPIPKGIQIIGGFAVQWRMAILATMCLATAAAAVGIAVLRPESIPGINSVDPPPVQNVSKGTEPEKSDDVANALPPGAVAQFGNLRYRVPDRIDSTALSPDGKFLAVESAHFLTSVTIIRVYDVTTWRLLHVFPISSSKTHDHFSRRSLTFSVDGRYLGHVPGDQYAYIWDLQTGKQTQRFECSIPPGQALNNSWVFCQFTSDGRFALSDANNLYFQDPITGREVRTVPVGRVTHLTADGRWYIRCKVNRTEKNEPDKYEAILGDARTGKDLLQPPDSLPLPPDSINVAFTSDGKTLVAKQYDGIGGKIEVWNIDPFKHIATFRDPQRHKTTGFPAGIVAGGTVHLLNLNGDVVRWETKTQKELPRLKSGTIVCLHVLPDGKTLLTPYHSGEVGAWESETGKEIPIPNRYGKGIASALSQDGKLLAVADDTGRIDLRNAVTGTTIRTIQGDGPYRQNGFWGPMKMVFNPAGDLLAVSDGATRKVESDNVSKATHRVRVIRVANGETVRTTEEQVREESIRGERSDLSPVGFSPDSRRLLLASWISGSVSMRGWDLTNGELDTKVRMGYTPKGISTNGKYVVSNMKGEVLFFDPVTGRILKRTRVEPSSQFWDGYAFGWSADGQTLACVIANNVVVILDASTGKERRRFAALPGEKPRVEIIGMSSEGRCFVDWVGLSPDGKWVVTTGHDSAGIWEVATGSQLATFETGEQPGEPHFTPENRDLLIFGNGVGRRWNLAETLTPNPKATATELWETLNKSEAKEAVRAANGLIATATGRDLLREKLPPAKLDATATQVKQWIADLGDPAFATRESAEKELTARARCFESTLWESARTTESPEVKNRLMRILALSEIGLTKDELRASRMVRAAEMDGTPRAIELLKAWSQGASGAILTEDAKAALERIDRLTKKTPR